ncbi:MAG TPA: VWA domain-containing protein, partial [Gammaproteobacteria bacterium]
MAEFHFLRPLWFVLLPVGAWLIWQLLRGRADEGGWRRVVDAKLRSHVLVEPEVLRDSRIALIAALVAWLIAIAALAGPTWERLPVPAFRSDEALVVALDLSRSMDAADVEPSRLARAKLKLLDLLERRAAGQTALVVFSTHAFTVTPLTTDTRTIASLVNAVNTDIMPTPGGSIAAGLDKAAALLRQTGLSRGDILLITDSEVSDAELDLARELAGDGLLVSVLAVGTEQGAPIPQAEGGFVNDDSGQVVVPQVDPGRLQRLASRGGGRFARLTPNDRDLETLFPSTTALPLDVALADSGEDYQADVWRDRGVWLAV